jgi:subtilisin family serine protease
MTLLIGVAPLLLRAPTAAAQATGEPAAEARALITPEAGFPAELCAGWSGLTAARLAPQGRIAVLQMMGAMAPAAAAAASGETRLLVRHPGGAAALQRAGLRATALSTTVASVRLAPAELGRLVTLPGVTAIDGLHRLRPRLDRSRGLIGATVLNAAGVSGRGVLVGFVDTGIDFRHADFRHVDGTTRVGFLLDAGAPRGTLHPELPDYAGMALYTADDLNAVLAAEAKGMSPPLQIVQSDIIGHGSHVAGIAGSSGLATAKGKSIGRYVGVASQSSLCVVKGTRDDQTFSDDDLLTGVRFCLDRAADAKQPVVINLSLGSAGGAHDGSSLLEQSLDELVGDAPGRAVVVAAGNSGEVDGHASAALLDGLHEIPIHIAPSDSTMSGGPSGQSSVSLEVYYDASAPHVGSDGAVDLELKAPGGKVLKVPVGQTLQGRFDDDGVGTIDNSDTSMTGLRGAAVVIAKGTGQTSLKAGDWTLRLRGRTLRYDVWLVDPLEDPTVALRAHVDPDIHVEIPAGGHNVIAVGALRSRMDWLRADGMNEVVGRPVGGAAEFSASGPTRDGRFAPDVLAPGEFVVSVLASTTSLSDSRSAFFEPHDPGVLVADDGLHGVLRGTSQAAPHVAGAVALLLQLDPTLTPTQVRELLRTTTAGDRDGGYGPRHGFGTLSLTNALTRLRGAPATLVDAAQSDVGVNRDVATPQFGEVTVTVTPRDQREVPLGAGVAVDISADGGEWAGPVVDTGLGRYERVLRTTAPRGTRITITAHAAGIELLRHPVVYLVGERSEIGAPFVLAGCTAAGLPGCSGGPAGLVGVALLLLLFRRRAGVAGLLACAAGLFACAAPEADSGEAAAGAAKAAPRAGRGRAGVDYFWRAGDTLTNPLITIHLAEQRADVFDGEALVAQSSVCTGRRGHKTPVGQYSILEKIPEHVSSRYGDYVDDRGQVVAANVDLVHSVPPPGTTFRGTAMPYFLRILGGVGMHAGPLPGAPDSHGCIRFPEFIAYRLFSAAPIGAPVSIVE